MNTKNLLVLCFAACISNSAFAGDIKDHLLSDAEISAKCESSIKNKLNLVVGASGEKITQCEHTYQTMRAVAEEYQASEAATIDGISSAEMSCRKDSTQENCLSAGASASTTAAAGHEKLAEIAEKGKEALGAVAAPANPRAPSSQGKSQ